MKQNEQLIKEVEINSQISDDANARYRAISQQLQTQNESFANLVKEKVSEKAQYETEKAALSSKIKSDAELIEKLENHIKDLNNKFQALADTKEAAEEMVMIQKMLIEENKLARETLLKKIDELRNELNLLKDSSESLQNANMNFLKENEKLKATLKVK